MRHCQEVPIHQDDETIRPKGGVTDCFANARNDSFSSFVVRIAKYS
jgi:hypothetical protein